MKRRLAVLAVAVISIFSSRFAFAKFVFPVQARLFVGTTSANPTDVNSELNTLGVKNMNDITQYGLELSYPVWRHLDVGLRYTLHYDHQDEQTNSNYYAELNQNSAMAIARVPLIQSRFIRLDGFAGFGGSNTTLKLNTPSQNGELTRQAPSGWFASPCASYGGSLSLGYKKFFLVFEAGYEMNKVTGLSRTSSINSNIQTIDLSGSYITFGVMFNGINATSR